MLVVRKLTKNELTKIYEAKIIASIITQANSSNDYGIFNESNPAEAKSIIISKY
jgi:hypothetical protein